MPHPCAACAGHPPSPSSSPYPYERAALAAGLVFVALQLAGLALFATAVFPHFAPIDAPADQRAAGYVAAGAALRAGNYLLMLPAPFFLVFVSGIAVRLCRAADPRRSAVLILAVAVSGTAMALVWPLAGVISTIALDIALAGGDAATISGLDAVAPYSLALSALARAVFVAAASTLLVQHALGPRWVAWTGFVLAGLALVGSATMVFGGLFPLLAGSTLGFEFWIVALVLVLWPSTSARAGA